MLSTLEIANYRSIRQLALPLGRLNVVTGANGTGKSNLYKALRLLSDAARGGIVSALAREGGLESTLWAGPEVISKRMRSGEVPVQGTMRREPINLRLGFCEADVGYCIDIGLPTPSNSLFARDPEIKRECIFAAPVYRPGALLADRRNAQIRLRCHDGSWAGLSASLQPFDTMLTEVSDIERAPEIVRIRDIVRAWRFYDHMRVDAGAPAREPCVGTRTPVLAADGGDLAAALQTIREIGDNSALTAAVSDWASQDIPDTEVRWDDDLGGGGWEGDRFQLSSSTRRPSWCSSAV